MTEVISVMKKIAFFISFFAMLLVGCLVAFVANNMMQAPPREVPPNLTAEKYYELGKRYKLAGWTEQGRKSLKLAMELSPDGVGKKAEAYLNAYLPVNEVPPEAIKKNIMGANQIIFSKDGAIKTFNELIAEYPNFEWPYGNLGSLYVKQGKVAEGKAVLRKALEINPHYVNAWIHLAEANLRDKDPAAARECVAKALEQDPDCESPVLIDYPEVVTIMNELKKKK